MKFLERTIETVLNGQTLRVLIEIFVEEDHDHDVSQDFDFGNDEDNEAYLARFQSGELFAACIQVKASALGESESDYLRACHIHSNNLFNSTPFETDVNQIVSEYGMIDNAIDYLKQAIVNKANALSVFTNNRLIDDMEIV